MLAKSKVTESVRKVKKVWSAVHPFETTNPMLAPMPTNNAITASIIPANAAFHFAAKPNSQCIINPAPTPSIIAENITNSTTAKFAANVAIMVSAGVLISASAM